jgi:putative glutamine amidotransferase
LLNVALGGDLIVDIPSQFPTPLNHRQMDKKCDPVHEINIDADSLLAKITNAKTVSVNSTHHQAIGKLAEPLRSTARSSDGIVEATELKEPRRLPFMISVQFHPERLYDRFAHFAALFKEFVRVSSPKI